MSKFKMSPFYKINVRVNKQLFVRNIYILAVLSTHAELPILFPAVCAKVTCSST